MKGDHPINIQITSGTIIRTILFVLLLVFLFEMRDLVLIILTAIVIASAIEPATTWLERRSIPRVLAVILIYLGVALATVIGFYLFIPPLLSDLSYIIARAPEYMQSFKLWGGIPEPFATFSQNLSVESLIIKIQESLPGIAGGAFGLASSVFGGIVSFLLIVVLSFYLAVQRDGIANFLRIVTPIKYETYIIDLWKRSQHKIGKWLQGQLLLSVIVGVLVYLGLMILGVPNALLLALLAMVLELIPLFGPILAAVPALAVASIDGGTSLGIMTLLLYVIIQQFENHLLYPLVTNKVVGVPAILVIVSLIVGGKLAGFIGVILAVPIAAALMEFWNDVERKKKQLHELETEV